MSDTPHRRWTDQWFINPVKLSFLAITGIFLIVLIIFAFLLLRVESNSHRISDLTKQNRILVTQNTIRIAEIQQSRIQSCRKTYLGIKQVFSPLYPPVPRTAKQRSDIRKFETTIRKLITNCVKQTKPKHPASEKLGKE